MHAVLIHFLIQCTTDDIFFVSLLFLINSPGENKKELDFCFFLLKFFQNQFELFTEIICITHRKYHWSNNERQEGNYIDESHLYTYDLNFKTL